LIRAGRCRASTGGVYDIQDALQDGVRYMAVNEHDDTI
jgi:hypothetical protein